MMSAVAPVPFTSTPMRPMLLKELSRTVRLLLAQVPAPEPPPTTPPKVAMATPLRLPWTMLLKSTPSTVVWPWFRSAVVMLKPEPSMSRSLRPKVTPSSTSHQALAGAEPVKLRPAATTVPSWPVRVRSRSIRIWSSSTKVSALSSRSLPAAASDTANERSP